MKPYQSRIALLVLLAISTLAGCATKRETDRLENNSQVTLQKKQQVSDALLAPSNKVVFRSAGAWLGNKPIPVSKDLMLPAVFRQSYEFRFPMAGRVGLTTFAERFTRITGIPVQVNQDVYDGLNDPSVAKNTTTSGAGEPAGAFAQSGLLGFSPVPQPLNNSVLSSGAKGVSGAVIPPPIAARYRGPSQFGSSLSNVSGSSLNAIEMNFSGTPKALLDQLSARLGSSWEYRNGAVVLSRLMTQTFLLKTTPGTVGFNFKSGRDSSSKSEGGQGGSSGGEIKSGFTSNATMNSQATMAAMDEVKNSIGSVLTSQGKVTITPSTGTITVTDTRDGIDRAAKIIDRENEILSRTAKFRVEVYALRSSNQDQTGVSWDAIFKNVTEKVGATISAPATIIDEALAGQMGVKILNGRFKDSSAMLHALAEEGKITNVYSVDVVTRNRRPTPVGVTRQTAYLAKTVPAQTSTTGGQGTPGLEPGTITTGFSLQLQPNILDSNQVALQFSLGVVDLLSIKTFTSGGQSIQLPETSGFEFMQDVALRPGETLVLTGYDRLSGQYTDRSLASGVPSALGGSYGGNTLKEKLAILITPISIGTAN